MPPQPGEVTILIDRWHRGDAAALGALMDVVYGELRSLADHLLRGERSDHTLQPTALVNEAYLRLEGIREMRFENRRHFYGAAARCMRRILVDHARQRKARKRGGGEVLRVPLSEVAESLADLRLDFEELDRALDRLAVISPGAAQVVELRYFAGLGIEETADLLDVSPATVKRQWTFARAWLFRELSPGRATD